MFRSGHNCLAWSDLDLHWEFPEGDLERDGCRWDQFTSCHHYRHHPHHCNHHHSSSPPKCRWVGLPVIIIITINTIFISDYPSCSSTYRQDQFTSYHHFHHYQHLCRCHCSHNCCHSPQPHLKGTDVVLLPYKYYKSLPSSSLSLSSSLLSPSSTSS